MPFWTLSPRLSGCCPLSSAPLRSLIEAEQAEEFAREAALAAMAWLTAIGRIDRDETARYLRDLHSGLQPQDASYVWVGRQAAISHLGLVDLAPLVEDVFRRGWIDEMFLGLPDFNSRNAAWNSCISMTPKADATSRPISFPQ